MGTVERRQRHRAELHDAILDAALKIVLEQGLGALSIRAIAERIEYSAATIYLHFDSKEALLREVAREGFRRLHESLHAAAAAVSAPDDPAATLRAVARAYLEFVLEHRAYFQVMFDVLAAAGMSGGAQPAVQPAEPGLRDILLELEQAAQHRQEAAGGSGLPIGALATVHGLVSLYLSGRLGDVATTPDELLALVENCLAPYAER